MADPGGLREVPLLVAVAGMCCPTSVAEVCFEWLKLTSTGWRLSFRATAPDPDIRVNPPDLQVVMGQAMSEISLTDDAAQPLPDQGGRAGEVTRAGQPDGSPGLRAR